MDSNFRLYCDHPPVSQGMSIRVTLSTLSVSLSLPNAVSLAQAVIINMTRRRIVELRETVTFTVRRCFTNYRSFHGFSLKITRGAAKLR
jgi:hypothetical protein